MKTTHCILAVLACLAPLGLAKPTSSKKTAVDTCTKTKTSSSKRCTTTTTVRTTVVETSTVPLPGISMVTTVVRGSFTVQVSTLRPTSGTATATVPPAFSTTTVPGTTTSTTGTIPITTVGTQVTITAPLPAGFIPVQDSLKNATYNFVGPCRARTSKTTTTSTSYVPPTATTTFYEPTYIVDGTKTYTNPTDFKSFSIVYTSTTSIVTQFSITAFKATPSGPTSTITASTTTIPGECFPPNLANAIIVDHGRSALPIWFPSLGHNDVIQVLENKGIINCCQAAINLGASGWGYRDDIGCFAVTESDNSCTPDGTKLGVDFGPLNIEPSIVVANGPCGRWTSPTYSAGL